MTTEAELLEKVMQAIWRHRMSSGSERTLATAVLQALGDELWSNLSRGGKQLTWRELADIRRVDLTTLYEFQSLVFDLNRCEHGRHEGDVCGGQPPAGCNGPSLGNPCAAITWASPADRQVFAERIEWWAEARNDGMVPAGLLGFDMSARPICVPPRALSTNAESYRPRAGDDNDTASRAGRPAGLASLRMLDVTPDKVLVVEAAPDEARHVIDALTEGDVELPLVVCVAPGVSIEALDRAQMLEAGWVHVDDLNDATERNARG